MKKNRELRRCSAARSAAVFSGNCRKENCCAFAAGSVTLMALRGSSRHNRNRSTLHCGARFVLWKKMPPCAGDWQNRRAKINGANQPSYLRDALRQLSDKQMLFEGYC